MNYQLEWKYCDADHKGRTSSYIHFSFFLRFPDIPPGKGHGAHFSLNVLARPPLGAEGIQMFRRGIFICEPFNKVQMTRYVEHMVEDAFSKMPRQSALLSLNEIFIHEDRDYSDDFRTDLIGAPELLDLIGRAFEFVERGDGLTFHQALVIDDYGTEAEITAARRLDSDTNWEEVPYDILANNPLSLIFLDPHGFRYYLPAAMSWSVKTFAEDRTLPFFTYLRVFPTIAPRDVGLGLGEAFDVCQFVHENNFSGLQVEAIYRFICFMAIEAKLEMNEDQYAVAKKWRAFRLQKDH